MCFRHFAVMAAVAVAALAPAGGHAAARAIARTAQSPPILDATATIEGRRYEYKGTGECTFTPRGSIYDVPAAIGHAMVSATTGPLRHMNVSLFQPTGTDAVQVTASVSAGSSTYDIATVRGGTIRGTATARLDRKGPALTLVVDGKTAAGQAVQLAVTCDRFTAPEDNG